MRWRGFHNTQQFGGHFRHNLVTGDRTSIVPPQPKGAPRLRYTSITGFHRDDDRPFVYRTEDFGASWRAITATLPAAAPANVIIEDHVSPSLLFLGTDRGLFASIDAGARWVPFQANMPIVPVRDLVLHPRENDLVVGTHGRGVWVADVTPLQQISEAVLAQAFHLFAPEPKGLRIETAWGNYRMKTPREATDVNSSAAWLSGKRAALPASPSCNGRPAGEGRPDATAYLPSTRSTPMSSTIASRPGFSWAE